MSMYLKMQHSNDVNSFQIDYRFNAIPTKNPQDFFCAYISLFYNSYGKAWNLLKQG